MVIKVCYTVQLNTEFIFGRNTILFTIFFIKMFAEDIL